MNAFVLRAKAFIYSSNAELESMRGAARRVGGAWVWHSANKISAGSADVGRRG